MATERLSGFDSASQSPGLALWHATNRWQALMRATLKPHGLTHVQYVLLAHLTWITQEEPDRQLTQSDLAAFAATDVMMTSQVLRTLEREGLVVRLSHPDDRRARIVTVTDAGARLARAATTDVERADQEFFAQLDDLVGFSGRLLKLAKLPHRS